MAKQIDTYVKLQVPAAQASPSPPVGPALGQHGLPLMDFCNAFNARTKDLEPGLPCPVVITVYEDKSFDLITGFLLLHEIPYELLPSLLKEVFRLLDEGGQVRFLDLPPYEVLSSERAFLQSFDAYGNGEVHWDDFLSRDLKSLLTEIGLEDVEDGPLVFEEPEFKGSAALMRTSEFRPENRWVTSARKMTSND